MSEKKKEKKKVIFSRNAKENFIYFFKI